MSFWKQSLLDSRGRPVRYPNASVIGNDPNTILLCHFDNDLTDSSENALTLTGNSFAYSESVKKFGVASASFNGTTNSRYATLPTSTPVLNQGTNNFTLEMWVYPNSQSGLFPTMFGVGESFSGNAFGLRYSNSGYSSKFSAHHYSIGDPFISTSSTFATGAFYHVALIRENSTTVKIYINGVLEGTDTISESVVFDFGNSIRGYIGRSQWDGANGYFNGYVDEFKISSVARWTANFTPPTSPYLM